METENAYIADDPIYKFKWQRKPQLRFIDKVMNTKLLVNEFMVDGMMYYGNLDKAYINEHIVTNEIEMEYISKKIDKLHNSRAMLTMTESVIEANADIFDVNWTKGPEELVNTQLKVISKIMNDIKPIMVRSRSKVVKEGSSYQNLLKIKF